MSSDAALRLEGIGKCFRRGELRRLSGVVRGGAARAEHWALRDINLDVPRGQRLGIVGANGAGKSTLLKVMSRITRPTTGRMTVRGRLSSLLEVGAGFHPELTGRENVYLNGTILGMRRREVREAFDDIVEFAGLASAIDTPVKRYSSGMYVRLAFSVAVHLRAQILCVDEVLAVGDHRFQQRCLKRMGEVATEGRTIVLVSHDLNALARLCERCLWIDDGVVRADGRCSEVIAQYLRSAAETPDAASAGQRSGPLRRVRMATDGGTAGASIPSDADVVFLCDLQPDPDESSLELWVRLCTGDGEILFVTRSVDAGGVDVEEPGTVRCTVPGGLLRAGSYMLTVWLRRGGVWAHETIDEVTLEFMIDSRGAKVEKTRQGLIASPLRWDRVGDT